ncbi:MAG: hypothetical protein KAU50_00045 [Candidatus Marinimicrobia bacterium]|nr:hypothetical protein [Candidatus Neomarinimicrobiota bacterium]
MANADQEVVTDPRIRLDRLEGRPWYSKNAALLVSAVLVLVSGGIAWGVLTKGQSQTAEQVVVAIKSTVKNSDKIDRIDREQGIQGAEMKWLKATLKRMERKLDLALGIQRRPQ